jgi:hypothetical protein
MIFTTPELTECLHQEIRSLIDRQRAFARDEALQCFTAHELHHHEPFAFVLEQLVDGGDAWMTQTRHRDGLRPEAARDGRIVQFGVENLDGDFAVQGLVDGAVHRPHPASTDALQDSILPYVLTDHLQSRSRNPLHLGRIRSLGGRAGVVN